MNHLKRVLTLSICLSISITVAANVNPPKVKKIKIHGYITAITSPNSFQIEDYHITRDDSVELEFENESSDVKFRPEYLRIGTELEIRGDYNEDTGELRAKRIKIDLEQFKKLKHTAILSRQPDGLQLTDRGWSGLFFADGRRIRVEPSTKVLYRLNKTEKEVVEARAKRDKQRVADKNNQQGDTQDDDDFQPLRSLTDIGPGVIMTYEGTVDKEGTILASRVQFERNELEKGEARLWESVKVKVKAPDYERGKAGELSISGIIKYKLQANQGLQEYVNRLGLSLIPRYQLELPDSDPQKIPFRFFVVADEDPGASSRANGVIIVNSGMFDLLENEAQLAAVIGHEIAHSVQEHIWRQMQYHRKKLMAMRIGSAVAKAYGKQDLAKLLGMIESAIRNGYSRSLENQSDRLGLEYMVSAGYDPREAPRVWKLMAQREGVKPTNLFYSSHDNHATRRSYLMLEIRNNYGQISLAGLKRNEEDYQKIVNRGQAVAILDSKTRSVVASQVSEDSLGIRAVFDQMVANAHPKTETSSQSEATEQNEVKEQTKAVRQETPEEHKEPKSEPKQEQKQSPTLRVKIDDSSVIPPLAAPKSKHSRIGQEAVTDFGGSESFLFAKTLDDHFARSKAEKAGDVEGYEGLRKSGRLIRIHNHSRALIVNSAKDSDGSDIFEIKLISTGKTVWIESRFLK